MTTNLNLFDGILSEETAGVATTNSTKEVNTDFLKSLVMVCFRITVWTGTTTEQISVDDGSESMIRKRIVPNDCLKPFVDLRNRAKRLCNRHGESYLSGYVMPAESAKMTLDELNKIRTEFIRLRDEVFASQYEQMSKDRLEGRTPRGCSQLVTVPTLKYVLAHLRFNFDAFTLASFKHGPCSSYRSFLSDFCQRMASDAADIRKLVTDSEFVSDANLFRCLEISEKLDTWRRSHTDIAKAAIKMKGAYLVTARRPMEIRTPEKLIDGLDSIIRLEDIDFFSGEFPGSSENLPNGATQVQVRNTSLNGLPPSSRNPTAIGSKTTGDGNENLPALTSSAPSEIQTGIEDRADQGQAQETASKEPEPQEPVGKWTCSLDSVLSRKRTLIIG